MSNTGQSNTSSSHATPAIPKLDPQTKLLAAMAYGEASTQELPDEMDAIASVIAKQSNARGYGNDIIKFAENVTTYSYVTSKSNARYQKFMGASDQQIASDHGMQTAVAAARNALVNGPDKSNGAWFWDGIDMKRNEKTYERVKEGIKITNPKHDVINIGTHPHCKEVWKNVKIRNRKTHKPTIKRIKVIGPCYYTFESTAGIEKTIFWKYTQDYKTQFRHTKDYQ